MLQKTKVFLNDPNIKDFLEIPSLNQIVFNSFEWFKKQGIKQVFEEYSPVTDYLNKEIEIYFKDYYFEEPRVDEDTARKNNLSYESSFYVKVLLINKATGSKKEQEIYFGDIPILTSKGTFIINGIERVVISQLIRSAGVFFVLNNQRETRKYFGAKLIPTKGSWFEFDTDLSGTIGVKVDKHRRFYVTSLLRIFGLENDEEILKTFEGVDSKYKFIEKTLKKDPAKDLKNSYLEVYRRLKPGELLVFENAFSFIENIFKNPARYDLGNVGRFKFNQRIYNKSEPSNYRKEERLINQQDLIEIVKEIIKLNNNSSSKEDDIDHLGNRRIRAVGELLADRLRVGMARIKRIAQDKISVLETSTLTPSQVIVPKPFIDSLRSFLMTSQLAQFMDQTNPLAQLENKRTISGTGPGGLKRKRAGFEARDIHTSHYGRICPVQTPEGPNIGLVVRFAVYSKLNELGFIETPYIRVKNGKITKEVIYLDAYEEEEHYIASGLTKYDNNLNILEDQIKVRHNGEIIIVDKETVDFIDVSPRQQISIAAGLIPFLENTDINRAILGANMQRQAVPIIVPQQPLVGTGFEEIAARDSGQVIIAEENGEVLKCDASSIAIKYDTGSKKQYQLRKFEQTNQHTCINQKVIVKKGERVKKGQIIADGEATKNGVLSLGQNLTVAFVSWEGYNFEDAIILSEKLVKNDIFSSIHINDYVCDVRETRLGPEITTQDIPGVGEAKLKDLDAEGIIRIGAEVEANDILVGKITPRGETELTPEEKLLRAIFGEKAKEVKDTSLRLEHGRKGRVIGIKIFSRENGDKLPAGVIKQIHVQVAELRKVMVGDKLAGRHGNKGVISIIVPEEDMPYLEDGTPVDIVLNPLGIISRMNPGQIFETSLGWAAKKIGYRAITPVFSGAKEKDIKEELKAAGLPETGQTKVYDGKTGELIGENITVGSIYMMKLNHLVEDKVHARSIGPYSLITQQPLGGKARFGGQRFGEMEVWGLEGYGAAHTLQEMLTIKSDDIMGRSATYMSLIKGEKIEKPNIPASFAVLVSELKGMGFQVELKNIKFFKDKNKEEETNL